MNFFSDLIRSLFHQHHSNPYTELAGYRHNGDSGCNLARVFAVNRAEKFPKLPVLTDRRPRGLDKFALSRSSPVRVINPDPFSHRWSARWAPGPKSHPVGGCC